MYAMDLSGTNVGNPLALVTPGGKAKDTGNDLVTMIVHKKNGNVLIRFGKRNAQWEVRPTSVITRVV